MLRSHLMRCPEPAWPIPELRDFENQMALINCSDCGAEISDSALVCLKCGRVMGSGEKHHGREWEKGAVIASCIGLLALVVSGYTAWIQRQQVRAQVWPNIVVGYDDQDHLLAVMNKGVGPAQIRSVQILVDGKPQPDWKRTFEALNLGPVIWQQSALSTNILTPSEKLNFMTLDSQTDYDHFRREAGTRLDMQICFCSTLNECWVHTGQNVATAKVLPVDSCAQSPTVVQFQD
jgi:hypothetical protein